jgi:hypothetical protein
MDKYMYEEDTEDSNDEAPETSSGEGGSGEKSRFAAGDSQV